MGRILIWATKLTLNVTARTIQPSDWNISAAGRRQTDSASMQRGKMSHVGEKKTDFYMLCRGIHRACHSHARS